MPPVELRNLDDARRFVLQGLRLQRRLAPRAGTVRPALEWALEIAASGQPLPPVGFVADVGHILSGADRRRPGRAETDAADLPAGLARAYEDFVLGQCYADASFERAGHVVRQLTGRDQARGVAFVVQQFRERAELGGVLLSPAIIKNLLEIGPDDVLRYAWNSLQNGGLMPLVADLYGELIAGARRLPEVLSAADVFELEHGTALAEFSQRFALRQVIACAAEFRRTVEDRAPIRTQSPEVPTHVLDDDVYPVGGFASLANRGSIESLVHSQLAYMEPKGGRPDLFDVKYLRDELLYYSRDENQFFRRRRNLVFVFGADLALERFKDPELPAQRIVLLLAMVLAAIELLSERLSADSLRFELLFPVVDGESPLADEQALCSLLFREALANGSVHIGSIADATAAQVRCKALSERSDCRVVFMGATEWREPSVAITIYRLLIGTRPVWRTATDSTHFDDVDAAASWSACFERLVYALSE